MSLTAGAKRAPPGLLSEFGFETKTTSGKVGNLLLVFHFSTPGGAGGNVGIAKRFPRAVERDGKPAFGFPRFPQPVISTGLPEFHYALRRWCIPANSLRLAACISTAA